jgi:energy-coupling factor transporter ATP-binding protein EcfA2
MIVITGPTGSGKTTTLATFLSILNEPGRKILTVEDPVEYDIPGVNQAQIKPAIGLTFAAALRSFVRQDPNVIMVGEVRDAETAHIAIHAALTGHLVRQRCTPIGGRRGASPSRSRRRGISARSPCGPWSPSGWFASSATCKTPRALTDPICQVLGWVRSVFAAAKPFRPCGANAAVARAIAAGWRVQVPTHQ